MSKLRARGAPCHTHTHTHTRTHTRTHARTHTRTHTYTHIHTRAHTHTHIHTHAHTHIHTHTHTHTHTRTHNPDLQPTQWLSVSTMNYDILLPFRNILFNSPLKSTLESLAVYFYEITITGYLLS